MLVAKNIDWDIDWDADQETREYFLPSEVKIPNDVENVSDYLTDMFAFYVNSYNLVDCYD